MTALSRAKIGLAVFFLLSTSVVLRAASTAVAVPDSIEQQLKGLREQSQALRAQYQTQLQAPGADRKNLREVFHAQMKPLQAQIKALIDQKLAERRAHMPPALLAIEDAEQQELQSLVKEYEEKRKALVAKYKAQRQAYLSGSKSGQ